MLFSGAVRGRWQRNPVEMPHQQKGRGPDRRETDQTDCGNDGPTSRPAPCFCRRFFSRPLDLGGQVRIADLVGMEVDQ